MLLKLYNDFYRLKNMKVLITGVPGTGKTTMSHALQKKLYEKSKIKYQIIEINKIANKYVTGKDEFGANIVNIKKTQNEINKILNTKENVIVDGHLGCDMKLKIDLTIVLRCNPKTLKKRLTKRDYPEKKINQNIEAEMIDYCLYNAELNYQKVIQLKSRKDIENKVMNIIKEWENDKNIKKIKSEKVDWLN